MYILCVIGHLVYDHIVILLKSQLKFVFRFTGKTFSSKDIKSFLGRIENSFLLLEKTSLQVCVFLMTLNKVSV